MIYSLRLIDIFSRTNRIRPTLIQLRIIVSLIALFGVFTDVLAQTPTYQDCLGAIPVCQDTITIGFNHNGQGNYTGEIANVSSCYAPEQRSVWFTWTVQQSGLLRFAINPLNQNQDHDWTLFNMTNATCSQLSSSTGASSAMVRSNTWGAFGVNGSTGVSTPNGGSGTCNGPGTGNGPKWCADLAVTAGQVYVLHITNWTGTVYGFTIDFSASTAVIYDNVPPFMDTILSPIECNAFDSLVIRFSENIKCDSTSVGDFQLVGPNGTHTITGVTSPICAIGADYAQDYTIHFSPPVTQIGAYKLKIIPGAGYVEDVCGNLDTSDSLEFYFNGQVEFDLTGTHPLCFGLCTGTLHASPTAGASPFSFNWNNSLTSDSVHSNVCAGTYIVTVTDDQDCQRVDTIEITEPDLLIATIDNTFGVSCPSSLDCDGGAHVATNGGTPFYTYLWPSNEVLPGAQGLCAGSNVVTVTDVNGCSDTAEAIVWVPDSIKTTGYGDTMICITNYAAIAATSAGGTPPYAYVWTEGSISGPVVSLGNTASVHPIVTTEYIVQSTDMNGCFGDTSMVTVKVRSELGVEIPIPDTICPYDVQTITASGTGGDSLYSYAWSNGVFGPNITVGLDTSTWYLVTVSDYCGTPFYVDSVYQQVGGYSPIRAKIRAEDDSLCPGESVYLIAKGTGGYNGPDEYRFDWKHTTDSNRIQFIKPVRTQTYVVTISDLCLSKKGVDTLIVYVGQTQMPSIEISPKEACEKNDVLMVLSDQYPGYTYNWYMGDGSLRTTTSADSFFIHQYSEVGCFDLKLELLSDFGCYAEKNYPCAVKVLMQPIASFSNVPANPTSIHPFIEFENNSIDAKHWIWNFDSHTEADIESFNYEFNEFNEEYEVSLVAISDDGCTDTLTKTLKYIKETTLYYPSSFTPNGDGLNDEFIIQGEAIDLTDFDLMIYDRWGSQVFRSNNPLRGWNGATPSGDLVPAGIYPFTLIYRNRLSEQQFIYDAVTISYTGYPSGLK